MKIGAREIGNGNPCYIIAEAGTNHAGGNSFGKAVDLIHAAADTGADAVKFQLFAPREPLFCPMPGDDKRQERWQSTLITLAAWREIKEICDHRNITFLASAFQPTAVQWLKELNVAAYKVASRAAATYPYDAVPGPFIISNGMDLAIPSSAWEFKDSFGLQCKSKYPTPLRDALWVAMFDSGLSDHSGTIWPGLDAMARGCPMIEVHFGIDKADAGNDAAVCLSVDQLTILCEARDAFATLRQG